MSWELFSPSSIAGAFIGLAGTRNRFVKDLLRVGRWVHPATKRELDFTPQRLAALAANTQKWIALGNKVYFPVGDPAHNADARSNLGFWDGIHFDGEVLWGTAEVQDEVQLAKIGKTITDVSVGIGEQVRASTGGTFPEVILHVAATPQPVIPGQGNFIQLARGDAVGNKISKLRREGRPQDQAIAIALKMKRSGKLDMHGRLHKLKKLKRGTYLHRTPKEHQHGKKGGALVKGVSGGGSGSKKQVGKQLKSEWTPFPGGGEVRAAEHPAAAVKSALRSLFTDPATPPKVRDEIQRQLEELEKQGLSRGGSKVNRMEQLLLALQAQGFSRQQAQATINLAVAAGTVNLQDSPSGGVPEGEMMEPPGGEAPIGEPTPAEVIEAIKEALGLPPDADEASVIDALRATFAEAGEGSSEEEEAPEEAPVPVGPPVAGMAQGGAFMGFGGNGNGGNSEKTINLERQVKTLQKKVKDGEARAALAEVDAADQVCTRAGMPLGVDTRKHLLSLFSAGMVEPARAMLKLSVDTANKLQLTQAEGGMQLLSLDQAGSQELEHRKTYVENLLAAGYQVTHDKDYQINKLVAPNGVVKQ